MRSLTFKITPERGFLFLALAASAALRLCLFDHLSGDMRGDMIPWSESIESEGAWRALAQDFSNYPPLYLYCLTLATWLPLPRLYAIKGVYVLFDYLLAWYLGQIAQTLPPRSSGRQSAPHRVWESCAELDSAGRQSAPHRVWESCTELDSAGRQSALHRVRESCPELDPAGRQSAPHRVRESCAGLDSGARQSPPPTAERTHVRCYGLGAPQLRAKSAGRAAMLVTLFLPTVVLNSSFWGQCDAMYTTGLVACVLYLLQRRPLAAMIAFGVAFSLKPQAVFLAPLILVLLLQWRFSPLWLYVVPAVYVALALPAWFAGRPLPDLLFLYAHQRILPFPSLTLGATNLYQWLSDEHFAVLFGGGLVLAAIGMATLALAVHRRHPRGLSGEAVLRTALASVVLMPYLLPAMHERYFFPADVLAVAYAFVCARGWIVAVLIQFASFFTYLPYLFDLEPVPRPLLAVVMGIALALLVRDLWRPGQLPTTS